MLCSIFDSFITALESKWKLTYSYSTHFEKSPALESKWKLPYSYSIHFEKSPSYVH